MSKIKLFKAGELEDGTQRFQSQLMVGRDAADFIMGIDGIMCCYGHGNQGMQFYEYKGAYEIVANKVDMVRQPL